MRAGFGAQRSGNREMVDLIPMENGVAVEGAVPICLLVVSGNEGQLSLNDEVSFIPDRLEG